jgi:uncharacterized protein (UPF0276 family)
MNRFGLPHLGIGIGLRTTHYQDILAGEPAVGFFEVLSENYMQTRGRPLAVLDQIAERYPIVLHGVSMSIGSTDPLDHAYLAELASLRDRTGALWVSDHLCWTGSQGRNTHDLLPLPRTEEALLHVVRRVREVQDVLGARIALENPSTYASFAVDAIPEEEFLAAVAREADCAILLDVNNVYVSARNHGFDPRAYLRALPMDRVVQIHVAGHTDEGTHVVDTHIGPVGEPVWELLAEARALGADASVLLEWDAEIPALAVVQAEAMRADDVLRAATKAVA